MTAGRGLGVAGSGDGCCATESDGFAGTLRSHALSEARRTTHVRIPRAYMRINLSRRGACVNVGIGSARRKQVANEIPMPRVPTHAGAWIFERLELEAIEGETKGAAVVHQALSTGGDQVRHRATSPYVSVQPQAAFHRVDHPLPPQCELAVRTIIERAIPISRFASHSRGTVRKSVAGNPPLESRGCDSSSGTKIYRALLSSERDVRRCS